MAGKSKDQRWREAIGKAVTKLTPEVIAKLKQAFAIDASIEQACYYAEIHQSTYQRWLKKYPILREEFARMRHKLPLKSKSNIAGLIETGDIGLSKWFLERRESEEYGEKIKHSGEVLAGDIAHPEDEALRIEFREKLKANVRKRWEEKDKKTNQNPAEPNKAG